MAFRPRTRGGVLVDPGKEILLHQSVGFQLAEADPGQRQMVHLGRALVDSPMLGVALDAAPHVGMKGGGLALEQRLVVGVAGNALACFDTLYGRVTGGAVVFQKRVRLGQLSR